MEKKIDMNKSVYELYCEYPEIVDILSELGFHDITKPGMLQTAGRFMTLNKGATLKHIDIHLIEQAFIQKGYSI